MYVVMLQYHIDPSSMSCLSHCCRARKSALEAELQEEQAGEASVERARGASDTDDESENEKPVALLGDRSPLLKVEPVVEETQASQGRPSRKRKGQVDPDELLKSLVSSGAYAARAHQQQVSSLKVFTKPSPLASTARPDSATERQSLDDDESSSPLKKRRRARALERTPSDDGEQVAAEATKLGSDSNRNQVGDKSGSIIDQLDLRGHQLGYVLQRMTSCSYGWPIELSHDHCCYFEPTRQPIPSSHEELPLRLQKRKKNTKGRFVLDASESLDEQPVDDSEYCELECCNLVDLDDLSPDMTGITSTAYWPEPPAPAPVPASDPDSALSPTATYEEPMQQADADTSPDLELKPETLEATPGPGVENDSCSEPPASLSECQPLEAGQPSDAPDTPKQSPALHSDAETSADTSDSVKPSPALLVQSDDVEMSASAGAGAGAEVESDKHTQMEAGLVLSSAAIWSSLMRQQSRAAAAAAGAQRAKGERFGQRVPRELANLLDPVYPRYNRETDSIVVGSPTAPKQCPLPPRHSLSSSQNAERELLPATPTATPSPTPTPTLVQQRVHSRPAAPSPVPAYVPQIESKWPLRSDFQQAILREYETCGKSFLLFLFSIIRCDCAFFFCS